MSIRILGLLRGGLFSPFPVQACSYFKTDRVAIGSKAWSFPALVLQEGTVSPRHALIVQENQGWVIQDMDSDNGICSLSLPGTDMHPVVGQQAARIPFEKEICCSVGAVVLHLKAFP